MKNIVIIGAGYFAKEIAFLIEDINRSKTEDKWNLLGYVDKDNTYLNKTINKYSILYEEKDLCYLDVSAVIGIGNPSIVANIQTKLRSLPNIKLPNLVHPSVFWDKENIHIGKGNLLCANNIFTTNITIGSFNIFNLANTIGHDCVIEDCCVINPGCNISGGAKIESRCLIGTGATIIEGIQIGEGAIVGAGAVVTKDIDSWTVNVGVPARAIKKISKNAPK